MELTGVLSKKLEVKTFPGKDFKKQEFVVTYMDGSYEQHILFEATNDRMKILEGVDEGDNVTVQFDIQGRQWSKDGREGYMNSLRAYGVKCLAKGGNGPQDVGDLREAKRALYNDYQNEFQTLGLTKEAATAAIGGCESLADLVKLRSKWKAEIDAKAYDDDLPF